MMKPLKMLHPNEMVKLILQSVEESQLFRSDWDREFVRNVLDMFLTKGDFPHFIEYYDDKFDGNDFETYFKDTIIRLFDEEVYDELENEVFGEEDGE